MENTQNKTELDVPAIAALRELSVKATMGNWEVRQRSLNLNVVQDYNGDQVCATALLISDGRSIPEARANAQLIAAMRNALPALLDAAERCAFLDRALEQATREMRVRGEQICMFTEGLPAPFSGFVCARESDSPDLHKWLQSAPSSDAWQESEV
jgi:hypothetical protein